MRILHVIRDLSVATGGPVRAVNGLAQAQARLGHDVAIITTDLGSVHLEPDGVDVHRVHARAARWAWAPALKSRLPALVRGADVVHMHMVWDYPVLVAARKARQLRVPYVLRPCGMFSEWSMSRSRLKKLAYLQVVGGALRDANAYHFATEGEQANSRRTTGDHPSFVIPLGVDVARPEDLPDHAAFAKRFPELHERRIVLFLSRLHPKKHADVLLEAFARVRGSHDDLSLVLAGPGEGAHVASLRQRARQLGVEERVLFTGLLSGPAVTEAYRAADVFVLPSAHENFGVAAIEAMATGCATIVSRNIDLAREIEAAGAGIATDIDPAALAEALSRVLTNGTLRSRLGNAAREFVQRRFAWDPIARATIHAYQTIASRSAAPR